MNESNNKTIESIRLHHLIDEYFEGRTSVAEEAELRSLLARTDEDSDHIAEAKAVMGLFAAARAVAPVPASRPRRSLRPLTAAVASIAILLISAVAVTVGSSGTGIDSESLCYASVGDRIIDDPDQIAAMVSEDLRLISEASDQINLAVENEFDSLREAFSE